MKTLWNIIVTIGVIVFYLPCKFILWVMDVYNSVAHPDKDDYEALCPTSP